MLLQGLKISRKQNIEIAMYSKRMVFSLQRKLGQRKRLITQKKKAILEKKKATLVRITRNKIKNDLKARGVIA
jgi:hypothetical protein